MRKDTLDSYTNLDPDKVHVVKNGIDTEEFKPDPATDVVTGLGIDLDKPSVVFVGRITRQKGLIHLVRAAEKFDPETQVVLLAGAPDTPEISQQIGDAFGHLQSTRGNVLWIEEMLPRAQVRQVLSHATVFACPSVYEPLGIVNLEAMACETAVVASAVGGIPEVVVDGVTGYLVPYDPAQADDPKAVAAFEDEMATKINSLTADPDTAREFGLAGRLRCIEEFDWSKIAAETVDVYRRALEVHQS
jgi:starch synthase